MEYQKGLAGQDSAYKRINSTLRNGGGLSSDDTAIEHGLDEGMQKGDMETVYRGLGKNGQSAFLKAGQMGVVKDNAFVSTTLDPKIASKNFTSKGGWQAAILVHPDVGRMNVNSTLGSKSEYSEEKEILLARGTNYRVTGIDETNKIISLQALPN